LRASAAVLLLLLLLELLLQSPELEHLPLAHSLCPPQHLLVLAQLGAQR
jgi:hypothetical protein